MRVLFLFLFVSFFLASCLHKAEEKKNPEGPDPVEIYYDYQVRAEEGKDDVTVKLQFRYGGEDQPSFLLEEPSNVSLDGEELKPDSVKASGVYYELIRPLESFNGEHTIVFTDSREKEHEVEFSFEPFTLAKELPEEISKKPFSIQLAGFPASARVHLVMIDTSYETDDVNEEIVVENGEILVDEEMLANLSKGPITLEISKEEEKPLKNASREGGKMVIAYALRREFSFVD